MKINTTPNPDFLRLRRTLLLEGKPDRVPQFDFNIDNLIKQEIIERPLVKAEDEIDFWLKSGYDYVQIRLKPEKSMVDTAKGEEKSFHSSEGTVKCRKDLDEGVFEWTPVYKGTWRAEDYNYLFLKDLYRKLPQEMRLIPHAADIYTRTWMAMGFEDFCYALYEEPELVEELFHQNAVMELRMLDVLVDNFGSKIGAIFYSDDLAYTEGLMVSRMESARCGQVFMPSRK